MIILNYVKKKNSVGSVVLEISGFKQNNNTIYNNRIAVAPLAFRE